MTLPPSAQAERDNWVTLPNAITLLRLLAVPVFLWLHLSGRATAALWLFVAAMVSDVVDGTLARLLHQHSRVGEVLDPIADKLMVLSAMACLAADRQLPRWLLAMVLFRDALLAVGSVGVWRRRIDAEVHPTRIGKYATFALVCLVVVSLVARAQPDNAVLTAYTVVTGFVAAQCVVVSTAQYAARLWSLLVASR